MGAYGTGWEEQRESWLKGDIDKPSPLSLALIRWKIYQKTRVNKHHGDITSSYLCLVIPSSTCRAVNGEWEWRGWGVEGGKTNMRGGMAPPFATSQVMEPYTSLPFTSRCCIVRVLWSCCHGDVGQSADVRAQRGFGAGSWEQTARAGAGSKLRLNLGHRDSPEQRQAKAQLTAEGGTKWWWGGYGEWRQGLGNTGSHIHGLL